MMLAEANQISDEKKTCDFGDDRAAEAEALAVEALRLAEEARRAGERLIEIRASIRYLTSGGRVKPKSEAEPITVEIAAEMKPTSTPEPLTIESTPEENRDDSSKAGVTRSLVSSPVSILKSPMSKSERKEVRYAPDTITSSSDAANPVSTIPKAEDDNLIVMLFDALGVDKLCGLDFDVNVELTPESKKTMEKMAEEIGIVKSASEESHHSALLIGVRPHEISAIKRQIIARKMGIFNPDPFATEIMHVADSNNKVDPPVIEQDEKPRSDSPELAQPEAEDGAVPAETVEPEEPITTEEPAAEAEKPKELLVVTQSKPTDLVIETNLSPVQRDIRNRRLAHPVIFKPDPFGGEHDGMDFIPCGSEKIDSPELAQLEAVEGTPVKEAPVPIEIPGEKTDEDAAVSAETVKPEDPSTTEELHEETQSQPTDLAIQTNLTPVQRKIRNRRLVHPVIESPDPFGGERDGMDFIPCGTENIDSEEVDASSPFCGVGL